MMSDLRPTVEFLARTASRLADGLRRSARGYFAVLVNPADQIAEAASGSVWSFPLALVFGYSILSALLLRVSWSVMVRGFGLSETLATSHQPNILLVSLAELVFFVGLSLAMLVGARVFSRQRVGLLVAVNCVATAVVPLSALTLVAWLTLYFSAALSLLVFAFGLLAAFCFFVEALRSQCDLPTGCTLYVVPLMIIVALALTGLFLFAFSAPSPQA